MRLKRYLEMRGADGGPWRRLPALPAFWVGILYDDASLDAAWDLVKDWSADERQKLRDDVPMQGFAATIRNRSMLSLADETLKLARAGSGASRAGSIAGGEDETQISRPARRSGRARHDAGGRIAAKYHGPWGGSVEPMFNEYAY